MNTEQTFIDYVFDEERQIWQHSDFSGIDYNDGDEVETRIAQVIENAQDISVLSDELRQHCIDWPSLYHLSGSRANILRPFETDLKGDVLEIGAGCGAITRYIGECGGNVLALEGSQRRSTIARSRTRDLKNVTILCDKFDQFFVKKKFDVITLIGVLEYANLYTSGDNPATAMLKRAKSFLKPNGKLIIAIENQLGLKYFAGAVEDHIGEPMYGIEGRYRKDQPQTFGRKHLSTLLENSGFESVDYFAPLPDYKFPVSIIPEYGFHCDRFDASALVIQSVRSDPQLPSVLAFSPELVWPILTQNDLALDLANSFLIVANNSHQQITNNSVVAWHFTTDRKRKFCKKTSFWLRETLDVEVKYQLLSTHVHESTVDNLLRIALPEKAKYVLGKPLSNSLINVVSRDGWRAEDVGRLLKRYLDILSELVSIDGKSLQIDHPEFEISGNFIDAIPQNIIVTSNDKWHLIDQEWVYKSSIKAGYLVFRALWALFNTVTRIGQAPTLAQKTTLGIIREIMSSAGLAVTEETILGYLRWEVDIQEEVSGLPLDANNIIDNFQSEGLIWENLSQAISKRDSQIMDYNRKVEEVSAWGHSISEQLYFYDKRIESLQQTIGERAAQILDYNRPIEEVRAWGHSMREQMEFYDKRIESLQKTIGERDAQILDYNRKIEKVSEQLEFCEKQTESLQKTIGERDTQILDYNRKIEEMSEQLEFCEKRTESLQQTIGERDAQILDYNRKIEEVSAWGHLMSEQMRFYDKRIESLQQTIGECDSQNLDHSGKVEEVSFWGHSMSEKNKSNDKHIDGLLKVISERDKQITDSIQKIEKVRDWGRSMSQKVDLLQQEKKNLNQKLSELSDWAERVSKYPIRYATKKIVFHVAKKIWSLLPLSPLTKYKIKAEVYTRLGRPVSASLPKDNVLVEKFSEYLPSLSRDILIFSVIDWHFRIQRPQHLAFEHAQSGHRVYYFSNHFIDSDEPGYQIEKLNEDLPLYQVMLHVKGAPPIYFEPASEQSESFIRSGISKLLRDFSIASSVSIVQHAFWYPVSSCISNSISIYDCMDHHEGFGNVPKGLMKLEKEMLSGSDLVVVTSTWLEGFAREYNSSVNIIRNAGEYDFFSQCPEEIYSDKDNRKIIGYYGAIAEWFDIDLVSQVAMACEDALVILIGNDTVEAKSKLSGLANVILTGEIPYQDLPYYLYSFDVCLLPFKVTELTLATNPVKVYEYLSAGKPIVSVSLPEIKQFGDNVWSASDQGEFVSAVKKIIFGNLDTPEIVKQRQLFASRQTWTHRVNELRQVVDKIQWPKISIVILTYNNLHLTKDCVKSVLAYSDYPNFEIILVDNNSTDDTQSYLKLLADEHEIITTILNDENLGFAAGNNVGLREASGDYLVILNNDTVVTKGWLLTLLRHLQRDPAIGLIGPVTNNIGNEAKIEIEYESLDVMQDMARQYTLEHMGKTYPLKTAAFFCVMMSREVYEKVGRISEEYGRGFFEDDDYCRRVEKLGLKIACADDVFVHHHLSASFNKLRQEERQRLFEENKKIYESKWGRWVPHNYRKI